MKTKHLPNNIKTMLVAFGLLAFGVNFTLAQDVFPACPGTATAFTLPWYWNGVGTAYAHSTGTSSAPGAGSQNGCMYHTASTMTVGEGYGIVDTSATQVGDGKNVVYQVETTGPSANESTTIIMGLYSTNCTIGASATNGTVSACTAFQSAKMASPNWSTICFLTNNAGVTHPHLECRYVSSSDAGRSYGGVIRFTLLGQPCASVGACAIQGPVSTNMAYVTVTGVSSASDLAVFVYEKTNGVENPNPIGLLTSGILVGTNQVPVTWDANSLGAQIIATQLSPAGQEGCHTYPGYIVGGGPNPRIRVFLNCKTAPNNGNSGPVGATSDTTGTPGLFFMPGSATTPSGGVLVNPSTNWQTVVIDPRTATKFVWSGTGSGAVPTSAANISQWAGLEGIDYQMDDTTDTGPFDILIDNVYSGPDLLVNFETDWNGGTYDTSTGAVSEVFLHPSYTGFPVGQFEGPDSALIVSNQFAISGTNVDEIKFQFSSGNTANWVRMLMDNGANWNYPQIHMDAPFQFDILLLPKGAAQAYAVGTAPPLADTTNCPSTPFSVAVNVTPPWNTATGQPLARNYTYQWKKNGTAIGSATQSSYTLGSAASTDSATYSVVVGDGSGNTLTRQMVLTVPTAVQIDTQPLDQGPMDVGSAASFSAIGEIPGSCPCANPTPIGYQWLLNGVPLTDSDTVSGSTTPYLNINPVAFANAGTYTCVLSNTCTLQTVTSTNALLWVLPNDPPIQAACATTGLLDLDWTNKAAAYPPSPAFTGLPAGTNAINGISTAVDYDWSTNSFSPGTFPNATDYFTLRFIGSFQAPYDPGAGELYTFYVRSDDGARLWVNGQLIVDSWINQSATTHSGSILLTTNGPVPIILEYFENTGSAVCSLSYSSLSIPTTVIPSAQLCPAVPGATDGTGIPPTVAITSPANNATDTLPAPVTLAASVTPWDGTINNVQFYNGAALLATVSGAGPYTTSWTPPAAGIYNISARLNYNGAYALNTETNKLTVLAPLASSVTISNIVNNGDGTCTISYGGGAGSLFTLMSSPIVPHPTRDSWTPLMNTNVTPRSFTFAATTNEFYTIQSK